MNTMETWTDNTSQVIESPFNVEKIISSDEEFYREWKRNPFWIVMEKGKVTIKYFDCYLNNMVNKL